MRRRVRKSLVAAVGALLLANSFGGSSAVGGALKTGVTWVQRAFAPAAAIRPPQRLQPEDAAESSSAIPAFNAHGPLLWLRRAVAPSVTPHPRGRTSQYKSNTELRTKQFTAPLFDGVDVVNLRQSSVLEPPSLDEPPSLEKLRTSRDVVAPLDDVSKLPPEGRSNFEKSRKISRGYEVLYDVKEKAVSLPFEDENEGYSTPEDAHGDPDLLLKDLHNMLHRMTSLLPRPLAAPQHKHVVELAVAWSRFVDAAAALHGDGVRDLSWLPEKSLEVGKSWGEMSLEFLNNTATKTTDGAMWLFSSASALDPRSISKATMDTIGDLNQKVGSALEKEIVRLMRRFEGELLSLKRQSAPERKNSPSCIVMGMDGVARRLNFGDAIPSLLFMKEKGEEMFDAKPKVSIETDARGNLIVAAATAGQSALPLSSDVMWMRQMAAYSQDATDESCEEGEAEDSPVTVAAVTLPVNERGDVLVTQRASRGMYNGMWVFPGGHVDGNEGVVQAAQREVFEETGIRVDRKTLKPRAVWEGTVTSKKRQFCVVFFEALAEGVRPKLQTKEVVRAAWVPRDLVPRILDTHVWHGEEIEGIEIVDGKQLPAKIHLSDLQQGLGSGHKFALKQYLEARDRRQAKTAWQSPTERLIPENVIVPSSQSNVGPATTLAGMGRFLGQGQASGDGGVGASASPGMERLYRLCSTAWPQQF